MNACQPNSSATRPSRPGGLLVSRRTSSESSVAVGFAGPSAVCDPEPGLTASFGLTRRRVDLLGDKSIVMHPGPMNRGVEIAADVADLPRSVVIDQVRNGVAVRMAVLFDLLGSGRDLGRHVPTEGTR